MSQKAMFYRKNPEDQSVTCNLCPHYCTLSPGQTGLCRVRKNNDGILETLNYFRFSSKALDPIEKKPLKEFHPGSKILSLGSVGCNFSCPFCQNYTIATSSVGYDNTFAMTAQEIIDEAIMLKSMGNIGLAYTYNEPTVWYETMLETAKLAKENHLVNVVVTNGYINPEPAKMLLPFIDAVNIDLKSYNNGFYTNTLHGGLEHVKETISLCVGYSHTEITALIIPEMNDSVEEMRELAGFLASVSKKIVLHINRFYPAYQWSNKPPTPIKTLYNLAFEAQKHLQNVYLGNI